MKKILLIFVMLLMYVVTSEMSAKKKAESFCDSVNIGDKTTDIRDMAISRGARGKDSNWKKIGSSTRQIEITFTGYYPGSDFICQLTENNGVVSEKKPYIIRSLF